MDLHSRTGWLTPDALLKSVCVSPTYCPPVQTQSVDITDQITVNLGCYFVPSLKCSSLFQGSPRWCLPVLRNLPPVIVLFLPPHQAPAVALGMSLDTAAILHYGLSVCCGRASSPCLSVLGLNLSPSWFKTRAVDCVGDRLHPISLISLSSFFWTPLLKKNCFSFSQKKKKAPF